MRALESPLPGSLGTVVRGTTPVRANVSGHILVTHSPRLSNTSRYQTRLDFAFYLVRGSDGY